jgi:hypothetical protein
MMEDAILRPADAGRLDRGVVQPADEGTASARRERPILFSAPMVRALLDGTKTQTRRVVKGAPEDWAPVGPEVFSPTVVDRRGDEQPGADAYGAGNADGDCWICCPYGQPGARLWVRETWAVSHAIDHLKPREVPQGVGMVYYPATENTGGLVKRPSIFMPRWASRITLEITGVRVERLQDISRGDAMAEGCPFPNMAKGDNPRQWYAELWQSINGPGSWDANPWVWVVAFRKLHNVL